MYSKILIIFTRKRREQVFESIIHMVILQATFRFNKIAIGVQLFNASSCRNFRSFGVEAIKIKFYPKAEGLETDIRLSFLYACIFF